MQLEKKTYKQILIWFFISRIVLLLLALLMSGGNLEKVIYNFDVEHYLTIAQEGYTRPITAFFPMIPLIMRFMDLFKFPVIGMMIVNNFAILISSFLLYKLTQKMSAVQFFLISPIAVFTFIAYTESLFMLLTLLVLYLYKEEKYLLAGICLGLGVCCRSLTAMLFFAIFAVMLVKFFQKKIKIKPILQMYIPATIISLIYPVYLQITWGNWKLFMDVQFESWARMKSSILMTILADIEYLSISKSPIQSAQVIYQFILLALIITLIIFAIKKVLKTKNELDVIAIIYLVLTIISIYSSCRDPYVSIPSASYYRYFYACISVYTLPTMFDYGGPNVEKFINITRLICNIILAILFALFYYANLFVC